MCAFFSMGQRSERNRRLGCSGFTAAATSAAAWLRKTSP